MTIISNIFLENSIHSYLSTVIPLKVHVRITFSAPGWGFEFSKRVCFCCFGNAAPLPRSEGKIAGVCKTSNSERAEVLKKTCMQLWVRNTGNRDVTVQNGLTSYSG
jgi:hypothetical protein